MEIPQEHQSHHLFLLVGTNPLPNYVAAQLLTQPGGHLHLVASGHEDGSSGTIRIAENIQRQFSDRTSRIIGLADVSDARQIERQIIQYMQDLHIPAGSRVGLNYTGGTKPMSVHTHEALQSWCSERGLAYQFSYLDPRQLAFRFANGFKAAIKPDDCPLSLETLVELHNWKITSYESHPILPEFNRQLAANIIERSTAEEWRRWCDWYLRTWPGRNKWKTGRHWEEFKTTQQAPDLVNWVGQLPHNELAVEALVQWVLATHRKARKAELSWVPVHSAIPTQTEAKTLADLRAELATETGWPDNDKGFKPLAKFLDGGWLEHYVLACIHRIAPQCQIDPKQARASLEIEREGKKVEFESDIAVMKGYRLFALSCSTTIDKGLLKHKLFEAYTRARQMGGDEARVALVGGYKEPESLLQEVNEEWMAPQDVIRAFGPQDWLDLEKKLADWFNWQPA